MMIANERDIIVIKIIPKYCREVDTAMDRFGKDYETFIEDVVYHNAVSMSIYQIGEISNHLSDEYKENYSNIPWKQIRGMRNLFAHQYHQMNIDEIWKVALEDIPVLKIFCEETLNKQQ